MTRPPAPYRFPIAVWFALAFYVLSCATAEAQTMAGIICDVYGEVWNVAGALATMALLGFGIAMMMGKGTPSTGVMILVGIGIVCATLTAGLTSYITGGLFSGCGKPTSTSSDMADMVCGLKQTVFDIAGAVSILAIMGIGAGAIMGKVSLTNSTTVAIGIGLVIAVIADGFVALITGSVLFGCI